MVGVSGGIDHYNCLRWWGFVKLKETYAEMQELLEGVPALIFLEFYNSIYSPLALIIKKPTHVWTIMQIPTNPGFRYWEI